jgi:hypothetical protein
MPYNSNGIGAIVPVERIKPILANMIGDGTAGGNANIQDYLDARRFIRAKVANVTARNGLTSPQDGDLVLVLDNGSGYTQLDRYKSSTSAWVTVAVEGGTSGGGGGSGGGSGAYKSPVRAATVSTLPTNTRSGNVLTASANGALPAIDGVTLEADNRLLVKNEATGANNGLYVVTSVGSASTPWVLTRAEDANTDALVVPNLLVFVQEGTSNGDTGFLLTTNATITLNTTALTFSRAMGGAGGVMGTPMVITETSTGSNLYNLPYTREHPMVWVDGSLQVKDSDYTVNASGQVTFTPALDAGLTVIASAAVYPTTSSINGGGGAMTVPAVVAANAGTNNATYALPGAGMEMVWKGGAIQVPGADYTRASNTITFVAGNIPAAGEDVVISVAAAPLVGTDALTLGGQTAETAATANTVAKRDASGVMKAANHANVGAAAAAGAVVALDSTGMIPAAALPGSASLSRFMAVGDLASIVASESGGPIIDYVFVPAGFTITAIDVLCPSAPSEGTITIDILRSTGTGQAFSSLYTGAPNTKPSLTCAGNASFATFTGTNLPNTTTIAAGSVLAVKLTAAPLGANDLYVTIR